MSQPATSTGRTKASIEATRRLLPQDGENQAVNRLAELAARLLNAPTAQVSLLTEEQVVAAGSGMPPGTIGSTGPLAESLCTVTAELNAPLVVSNAEADERVSRLPPVTSGVVGSYLGVPLADASGIPMGALCVYGRESRSWSSREVEILAQLASSVVAELELSALSSDFEANQARWELAVDAGGIGTFDWDLTSGELLWDERLINLFGYTEGEFEQNIEAFNTRLHPDDVAPVAKALQQCIDTCGEFNAKYRVLRPDGTQVWVQARGRALCDEGGRGQRLLGAAYDITAVQESEAKIVRVLETMSAAFYSLDHEWRFTYVNPEGERILGRSASELLGGSVWELFPDALNSDFEVFFRRSMDSGEQSTFEAYYPAPLDEWYELRVWPTADGLSVYFLEITARHEEQERSKRAAMRASLLAEVASSLAGTLDASQMMNSVARLVVPALGDWCIVSVVDDEPMGNAWERLHDVAGWHANPQEQNVVERYTKLRIASLRDRSFLARALNQNETIVIDKDATSRFAAMFKPGEAMDALKELAPQTGAIFPLRAHDRTLGLLTIFSNDDRAANAEVLAVEIGRAHV